LTGEMLHMTNQQSTVAHHRQNEMRRSSKKSRQTDRQTCRCLCRHSASHKSLPALSARVRVERLDQSHGRWSPAVNGLYQHPVVTQPH